MAPNIRIGLYSLCTQVCNIQQENNDDVVCPPINPIIFYKHKVSAKLLILDFQYHPPPPLPKRIGLIPLQPITNQFSKEATVSEIVSIFDEYCRHEEDTNPFKVMISEFFGNNIMVHLESIFQGYCGAKIDSKEKAKIVITDT